jgi:hypothetical protein
MAAVAVGYAVEQGGELLVETISSSERGAKVNWLWTHRQVPLTNDWTDYMIGEAFLDHRHATGARLVTVRIEETAEVMV